MVLGLKQGMLQECHIIGLNFLWFVPGLTGSADTTRMLGYFRVYIHVAIYGYKQLFFSCDYIPHGIRSTSRYLQGYVHSMYP